MFFFYPSSSKFRRNLNITLDKIYQNLEGEKLHLQFYKHLLKVHCKSSNFAVRSELGRLHIHFDVIKNMLLYWHRLETLQEFPLLSDAF